MFADLGKLKIRVVLSHVVRGLRLCVLRYGRAAGQSAGRAEQVGAIQKWDRPVRPAAIYIPASATLGRYINTYPPIHTLTTRDILFKRPFDAT